jgi:hypothetical protein
MCLGLLAEAKQGQVTQATLTVYVPYFRRFELADMVAGVESLIASPRREGHTSFPEVAVIVRAVADAERKRRAQESRKFFCEDCRSECGFLIFDKSGRRLRGADLVNATHRYAKRCPCGGREHEWATMHRERENFPELYAATQGGAA